MNRLDYISKINTYAARFVLEVEGLNALNQYHINCHAENFLIPVLNDIFDLTLENLNATQRKNFPAIDIADFKNRVAFQITATNDIDKIKKTLETFFHHGLNRDFDVLYFYIITHKKEKYNDEKLKPLITDAFHFSTTEHVFDKDSILQKINAISSTPKIAKIAKLFEHEFSDVQIELRKKQYIGGYFNTEPENIFPNLLTIKFPQVFYKAELDIDEERLIEKLNEMLLKAGKKAVKNVRTEKLVKRALKEHNSKSLDWLLHEKCIYTFRDLHDSREPLSKIVDLGTITPLECKDYYTNNDDCNKVFKHLLRNSLMELCRLKQIEWFGRKHIFRFANDPQNPRQKRVKWKGKKESTKTVIFGMMNKKDNHLICFRSLAFISGFYNVEDDWYLVLNPTWSFTNPGGYSPSRFESSYMTGLKRLESNNSVYNYFRFFAYYLSYTDLFNPQYPYLKVNSIEKLSISPRLEDKAWLPVKNIEKDVSIIDGLKEDNELNDTSLFD